MEELNILTDIYGIQPEISEQERFMQNKFAKVSMTEICQKYKDQGLVISDLTLSKYKHMFNSNSNRLIPVFPKIQLSNNNLEVKQYHQKHETESYQFLDSKDLIFLKKKLLSHIDNDSSDPKYLQKILFRKNKQQPSHNQSQSSLCSLDIGNRQASHISKVSVATSSYHYSAWDELQFQLNHNKGQLIQNHLQYERDFQDEQSITKVKEKKMPRITVKPIKKAEELPDSPKKRDSIMPVAAIIVNEETTIHYVYWTEKEQTSWRPSMREGHTLTMADKKIYCYGGIGSKKHSDMICFDPFLSHWKIIEGCGERPNYGRNNHSAVAYKKSIYIYGGEREFDSILKVRECANDFRSFNTENNEWKVFKPSGDTIEGRRGHLAAVVGRNMVLFGGINIKGVYRNDMYHMDIPQQKLSMANVEGQQIFHGGIAFGTATSIYNFEKQPQLYKIHMLEENNDKNSDDKYKLQRVKVEGVYIFGGEDVKGNYYSELCILHTNMKPMQWAKAQTTGKSPCARIRHSAVYHNKINVLAIYGGIDEKFSFLNDVNLLRMDMMQWSQVIMGGLPQELRAGHCAVLDDRKMILFGGYNQKGFVNGDICYLELDSKVSQKLLRQYLIDTTHHKDIDVPSPLPNSKIGTPDVQNSQQYRKQVEKLNYKNLNSFLPMPVKFKIHNPYLRMNRQQEKRMETIKLETSHFVSHELSELEKLLKDHKTPRKDQIKPPPNQLFFIKSGLTLTVPKHTGHLSQLSEPHHIQRLNTDSGINGLSAIK